MSDPISRRTALSHMSSAASLTEAARVIKLVAGRASTPGLTETQHIQRSALLRAAALILEAEADTEAILAVHYWRVHKEGLPYESLPLRSGDSSRTESSIRQQVAESEGSPEVDRLRDQAGSQTSEAGGQAQTGRQ